MGNGVTCLDNRCTDCSGPTQAICNGACVELTTDPDRNRAMGDAARIVAAGRFSAHVLASTMMACYEKAIGSAAGHR